MLADLKMPGALEAVDSVPSDADGGGVTTTEAIERLLGAQIILRNNRRLQTAMRSSRLPIVKTLDEFDFSFQPSIKRLACERVTRRPPIFNRGSTHRLVRHHGSEDNTLGPDDCKAYGPWPRRRGWSSSSAIRLSPSQIRACGFPALGSS